MSIIKTLGRTVHRISQVVNSVGIGIIVAMMLLTTVDVSLRYLFNRPILGSVELTEFMMLLVVALGLAYTQLKKGHIFVELIVSRFSSRVQAVIESIGFFLCLVMYLLIVWQAVVQAKVQWVHGVKTGALMIPKYPFYFILAFGCLLLCLVFLIDLIESLSRVVRK
ncbi:TRAP transporter small permease [Candidatus Poribacteria bacterium]|nr:TRAP transporter small permease [Candidatus Poribacteria bacterium]